MPLERRTIVRCSKAAFWFGIAAIACGIVSFATLNSELLLLYLLMVLITFVALIVLRCNAGRPLNCEWAYWAIAAPCAFLALSIFLFPFCSLIHMAGLRTQSLKSLKQIARGILDYHAKHDHLPPAAIKDAAGTPLLSWRVAILPFLGEEELYRQFHLNEAWDSPHNLKLLERMPAVYHTRLQPGETAPPHTTFYQVFVGPRTAFEPGAPLQIPRDFPDGLDRTILLVEAGNPVPWSKPEDLVYDPKGPLPALSAFRRDKGRFPWTGGEGTGSVGIAFCDGEVRLANQPALVEGYDQIFRSAITRNGRDFLPADW